MVGCCLILFVSYQQCFIFNNMDLSVYVFPCFLCCCSVRFVNRELGLPCGYVFLGFAGVFWLPTEGLWWVFWVCRFNMVPLLHAFLLALRACASYAFENFWSFKKNYLIRNESHYTHTHTGDKMKV